MDAFDRNVTYVKQGREHKGTFEIEARGHRNQ